eukprot:2298302-Prymnesium_polylepis.1
MLAAATTAVAAGVPASLTPPNTNLFEYREASGRLADSVPIGCLPRDWLLQSPYLSLAQARAFRADPGCANATVQSARTLRQLVGELERLQGPGGCDTSPHATLEVWSNTGWGAMLHGIVKPLMYTFAMGKVLRTPRIPGWTDAGCRGRDLGCVMQSFAPSCDGDTRLSP